jgi:hypothetical protein
LGATSLSGCLGSSISESTATQPASQLILTPTDWASISTASALTIRYPKSWYGQTYAASSATISSFPIHQPDQAVGEQPSDGALIEVLDQPPQSLVARYLPPRPPNHLELTDFQTYEIFGAAYRIGFHDRGHRVTVFVALGTRASNATRQDAIAVLNSIRAQRGVLPRPPRRQAVTLHLGIGRRHARIPVIYAKSAPSYRVTTRKPATSKLTGYFDMEGLHLATIGCPSRPRPTCRAGPFEGVKLGNGPWVWYLRIAKRSMPPATVRIVIRFG